MKKEYDVVIIGGGVAGISAAMSSTKMGAKTALIEKTGYLGGMATGSYVVAICGFYDGHLGKKKVVKGNLERFIDRMVKEGHGEGTKWNRTIKKQADMREFTIDPEGMKYVLDQMMIEHGVDVYLHTFAFDCLENKDHVIWIEAVNKEGRMWFGGKIFIDASGDADTAVWLQSTYLKPFAMKDTVALGVRIGGLDTSKIKYLTDDKSKAPAFHFGIDNFAMYGWMSIKNKQAELFYDSMHLTDLDGEDIEDITRAEMRGRDVAQRAVKELRQYPGCENAYIISTGTHLGNRKPRHVITRYYLTDDDENQDFSDSIAIAGNVMVDYGYMKIPYRCLLPKKIKNLLYCGRTFTPMYHLPYKYPENIKNRNFTAFEIPRLIAPCFATGEASGIAAALCADQEKAVADIDVTLLQKELKKAGAVF